jgi:hypothetical protein
VFADPAGHPVLHRLGAPGRRCGSPVPARTRISDGTASAGSRDRCGKLVAAKTPASMNGS